MKTLLLIDANSFIHRAFHAMPPLTGPDGQPTGAIFGFANTLFKCLGEIKPDYAAAAFDRPEPTFRKQMYKLYKANRPKTPDELAFQISESRNLIAALGLAAFELPGYEADDIIGTIAEKMKNKVKIVILTGDLDSLQLVEDGKIEVLVPKKGVSELTAYDHQAVLAKFGVPPSKIADYKGLVGDSSDNIPGIPGIGPKTAAAIIDEFGSVEKLFKKIGPAHPLAKKILPYQQQALLSKKLATIKKDVPVQIEINRLTYAPPEPAQIIPYLQKLGFQSLINRLSSGRSRALASADPKSSNNQSADIPAAQAVVLDGTLVAQNPAILSAPQLKIAYDLKNIIKDFGVERLREPYFDIKIAGWLIDPDQKNVSLEALSKRLLKKNFLATESQTFFRLLYLAIQKRIEELGLQLVWEKIEKPLIPVLADIESFGIRLNLAKLADLKKELESELQTLEKSICVLAGEKFNLNSPKQLSQILFGKILTGHLKTKITKTGQRSTSEEVLKKLKSAHPIIAPILAYRESFKILTTYVEPLLAGHRQGKIYTSFLQTGTATGRLSSEKPNLQNIPVSSKWAKAVRSVFESSPDTTLVSLDYSQLELRLLAHTVKDRELLAAFAADKDIHRWTASKILGVAESKITDEMRKIGKTLNFGMIYGMGPKALSQTGGLSLNDARQFIQSYFVKFPAIKKWRDEIVSFAKANGYVKNENGRIRLLPDINSAHPRFAAESERMAINMPLQSLGADILKLAMIKIRASYLAKKIWGQKIKILLSIHDELLLEISDDMLKTILPEIKNIMENIVPLNPDLKVDVSIGKNWGSLLPA